MSLSSAVDKPTQGGTEKTLIGATRKANVWLVVLLVLGGLLYLQQSFQYFMYDDEGTFTYAAWRVSAGEIPYKDFFTSQMPAFLYWGGLLVRLFGRTFVPLRLASMVATLAAAYLLYAINRELLGPRVAIVSAGLFLLEPNIFHNARFFESEAYMVMFDLAGIYCFVLSEKRGRARYAMLAGLFFGLSVLSKLFGFLPLAGCYLYLLHAWGRERRPLRQVGRQGLALGAPAALMVAAVGAASTLIAPPFFRAVFGFQAIQVARPTLAGQVQKTLALYWAYAKAQPVILALAALGVGWLWRRGTTLTRLWVCQVPTALGFFLLSRSLLLRHLTYLAPVLATLAAPILAWVLARPWRLPVWKRYLPAVLPALALTLVAVWPWMRVNANVAGRRENDSAQVAALIQELTAEDELVVSDYSGFNFMAARRTTHWGAELSGYAADSGQMSLEALRSELEQPDVALVVLNIMGGAHHTYRMKQYAEFRRYVQSHFALLTRYDCQSGRMQLEVYGRRDTMPFRPAIAFQDQLLLTGVRLGSAQVASDRGLDIETRWQALARMQADYSASLCLVDSAGRPWAEVDERLVQRFQLLQEEPDQPWKLFDSFYTSSWTPGQVVFQRLSLPVGPNVPSGAYYLVARLHDAQAGCALPPGKGKGEQLPGGDTILATVQVQGQVPGPKPKALPLAERLKAQLAEGLELVGVGALPGVALAGDRLGLELFWRSQEQLTEDYRLELRLRQGDAVRQRWVQDLVAGRATSTWRKDEVLLGDYALPLAADLEEGSYVLEAQLLDGQGLPVGPATLWPGDVRIERQAPGTGGPGHPLPDAISFGGRIGLLGYEVKSTDVWHGESVGLTLHWRCLGPVPKDYKVFVHLLGEGAQIQGQCDILPGGGTERTSEWQAGEEKVDHYEVWVPDGKAKELRIEVGLYDPQSGQRLPVERNGQPAGEDRLILPATVTVR